MEDLRELPVEKKSRAIRPGIFFQAAPAAALKPNSLPVLVKPTGRIFDGYFLCKVLGPCLSGEVTVRGDRACHVNNVWARLTVEEATELAGRMRTKEIERLEFLNL